MTSSPVDRLPKNPDGSVKAGPGRPKGKQNKITEDLRTAVLLAAAETGNKGKGGLKAYLKVQARDNPQGFMQILARCMPKDINLQVRAGLAELLMDARERAAARRRSG